MAEEKKVIKVNDLIIQAEHVHFEPTGREGRPEGRPFDPIFGRRPPAPEPAEAPDSEEPKQEAEDAKEEDAPQPERRRPFSWL